MQSETPEYDHSYDVDEKDVFRSKNNREIDQYRTEAVHRKSQSFFCNPNSNMSSNYNPITAKKKAKYLQIDPSRINKTEYPEWNSKSKENILLVSFDTSSAHMETTWAQPTAPLSM